MITKQVFKGNVDSYDKIKDIDTSFLMKLKDLAKKDFEENIGQNWDNLESFYAGKQWDSYEIKKGISYNALGQSIYDTRTTYSSELRNDLKPKRTQNITKTNIETLVAWFAQKDPMPIARSKNNATYNYDNEVLHKINLLLYEIFKIENDFNSLSKLVYEEECVYGHDFIQIKIDEDKAKNPAIPIKFRQITPRQIYVDPEAITLDEADYIIQDMKIKYWELKSITDYKFTPAFKDTKELDDMELVDVDVFWIRTKNDLNLNKWVSLWIYKGKWVKLVDDKRQPLPIIVYDDLPFEILRTRIRERWYGDSIATSLIPINIEWNKALSEMDWNWMMYTEPPIATNCDPEKVKKAQKPSGVLQKSKTGQDKIEPLNPQTGFISSSEYANRFQMLNAQVGEIMGNVGVLSGSNPTGTYSGAKLDLLRKGAELKPAMVEEENLKAIARLAEKTLRLLARWIEGRSIVLFDPDKDEKGGNIVINSDDINQALYKIEIQTKDANLMTKEAKLNVIKDFMQYGKVAENMPYYMLLEFVNETISGLFPKVLIDNLKTDYETTQKMKSAQLQLQNQGQQGQSPIPGQETPPQSAELPEEGGITQEDMNLFYQKIDEYKESMEDFGVPQDKILEIMTEIVDKGLAEGKDLELIISEMEEEVNKTNNIYAERLKGRKKY